ncbi:MAG: tagaturonate reductase [Cyclobacteriaceae bacterium]
MNKLARNPEKNQYPVKVIQFGEGNFLRAFVDWMIDILNEKADFNGSVAIVQPLPTGLVSMLNAQDRLYHHIRQGLENGKTVDDSRLIECVSKAINPFEDQDAYYTLAEEPEAQIVFSNTTEAGIVFNETDLPKGNKLASTFPGKLTQLLLHRFDHFSGDTSKGLAVIPCELIEQNGTKLKACVNQYISLWKLSDDFQNWVDEACSFANTLVDRIVPGYPKDEIDTVLKRIGVDDKLVVKSESFHLFVIQADERVKSIFPAHKHGLNVKYVDDITPYRTQKVRILNGAHTSMVPIGLLNDIETVSETINDEQVGKLVRGIIFDEIVETIQIPGEDPKDFANEVIARFQNPFIRHELITISLNSISKFKVRVLPTLLDYIQIKNTIPTRLTFSLACLIHLYTGEKFTIKDNQEYLDFFKSIKSDSAENIVSKTLANTELWGQDLTKVSGLQAAVQTHYQSIESKKMNDVILSLQA